MRRSPRWATSDGAIVALDPRSGAVLAMVSRPFFDPNASGRPAGQPAIDPAQPLFNRALQALYVPGSTFKTITATAALDTHLVDLNQPFLCTTAIKIGTYSVDCKNSQHIPRLTYKQAYAWSSNRVFGLTGLLLGFPKAGADQPVARRQAARRLPVGRSGGSIQPSADVLIDYAQRFGFERAIPFDLPVATSQIKKPSTEWTPELLVQTAFGQGELQATPLQMALVAAAVANGGRVPTPYLAAELRNGSAARPAARAGRVLLGRELVRRLPRRCTASWSRASTTATPRKPRSRASKSAARPARPRSATGRRTRGSSALRRPTTPRIAIAVIMEHQGSGSDFATPAAQQVMRAALAIQR